jgi:acetyl-CoA carboxylase carboxyl transferase subunit alpha
VDKIIAEPLGGAHRDPQTMMQTLRKALQDALKQVQEKPLEELLQARFAKLMEFGRFKEVALR